MDRLATIARALALLEAGYSYADVAADLGVGRSQVQRLEASATLIRERAREAVDLDRLLEMERARLD